MATQDEIIQLKEELKKIEAQMKKSRTRAAVGFVLLVFVMFASVLYGFVERVSAAKNAEEALRQRIIAQEGRQMAEQNAEEARKQEALAHEARAFAAQQQKELEECRARK